VHGPESEGRGGALRLILGTRTNGLGRAGDEGERLRERGEGGGFDLERVLGRGGGMTSEAKRDVVCADAIPWMKERGVIAGACAVTSLPDVSEVGVTLEVWREWFLGAVKLVVEAVPVESAAIFFQSDIKRDGVWIDKGAMVMRAAEEAGAHVLFHKIVLRRPAGMLTAGRPGFTHFIAVSRAMKCPDVLAIPDVIADAGEQKWVRAMGVRAAGHAGRFARDVVGAQTEVTMIFDPFCGVGTVLAVANWLGLDALGVEKNRKRAEGARELAVRSDEV
jgi:hypothetical protein